jgi:hypothetical protein
MVLEKIGALGQSLGWCSVGAIIAVDHALKPV